jgi:hypothetical protein
MTARHSRRGKLTEEYVMNKLNSTLLGVAVTLCSALYGSQSHAQAALSTDMDTVDKTLDLFFVAKNSNLYETVYPFSTTTQITGVSSRPALAVQGGVVSYVNTIYGAPEVFYVTTDSSGNQDIEQLWGTTFSPTNLSQKTGAESAIPGSSLVGFIDSCADSDNVFYIGNNGHVELVTWTPGGGWITEDLTANTKTGLAVGTSIIGHIKGNLPNQAEEVFYVENDSHIHELWRWSGCTGGAAYDGWHNADASIANGDTGVTAAPNSSLAGLWDTKAGTDAVFYVGTEGHLHELFFSAAAVWSNVDITHNSGGPALVPSTALTAHVNIVAGSEEVYYFDTGGNVREMWTYSASPTSWNSPASSINSYAGGAPAAAVGSPLLADINTLASLDDVYYIGANQDIYELTGGSWRSVNVTSQSMGPQARDNPPGSGSTLINFDTDTLGNAIPNGQPINDTYSSWGVTFAALGCVHGVYCYQPNGNIYAVAYPNANSGGSSPKGSAPNAVSTYNYSAVMGASAGVIRATFATPQSQVSIMAYQICSGQDLACLPGTSQAAAAYLDAYDINNNLLCHTPANPSISGSWQPLLVTSNCALPAGAATIAYVQFSTGYNGSDDTQLSAEFDNLTF